MNTRRTTFGAAVRLGIVLSTVAAILALGIEAVGDVSSAYLATTVAAVGFVTSWVLTGRVSRTTPVRSQHRVAVIPLRHPVG